MNPLCLSGASLRALAVCAVLSAACLMPSPAAGQDWQAPAWLMDADAVTKFRKQDALKVASARQSPALSAAQKDLLQKQVSYYLSLLTLSEDKDLPGDVTEKLVGPTGDILNSLTSEVARDFMLADTLLKAPELLNHPKDIVRVNAALLIRQMSSKPADVTKGTPPAAYIATYKVLCDLVQDSTQIPAVKIVAAGGLQRVCEEGSPVPSERSTIALALLNGLDQMPVGGNEGTVWFRWKAVRALGYVDEFNNAQSANRPIVFEKLMIIVANRKESYAVRAEAVRAISRLPLGSTANLPLVIHESCSLLAEMNGAYAKQPDSAYWRVSFSNIFFSFKPGLSADANRSLGFLYQLQRPGLGVHTKLVNDAWKVVASASKPVVDNDPPAPVPAAAVKALDQFVADNPVADRKPTPTSEPLPQINAAPPVANDPGSANGTPRPESGEGSTVQRPSGGGE